VPLRADGVRLAHPRDEGGIDVAGLLESKCMQVIPWRKRLDLPKPRVLEAACENYVAVQPSLPRRNLRERHADLKRDARLLGENGDGADCAHSGNDEVKQFAHDRLSTREVVIEVVQRCAGVRLIPVRESTPALRAAPE